MLKQELEESGGKINWIEESSNYLFYGIDDVEIIELLKSYNGGIYLSEIFDILIRGTCENLDFLRSCILEVGVRDSERNFYNSDKVSLLVKKFIRLNLLRLNSVD